MLLSVSLVEMDVFVKMKANFVNLVNLTGSNTLKWMNVYLAILNLTNG